MLYYTHKGKGDTAMNIKNKVSQRHFYNEYNRLSACDAYIIAFPYGDNICYTTVKHIPYAYTTMTREATSKGGYQKMKFNFPIEKLQKSNFKILCSMADFENCSIKNRGNRIEKFLHEQNGENYKPDNIPFYMDGDIHMNGISYQIKWYQASFTNLNCLHNAQAYARAKK